MANIILPPSWKMSERSVTPEAVFRNRRRFLRDMGFGGVGLLAAGLVGCQKSEVEANAGGDAGAPKGANAAAPAVGGFPAKRNPSYNPAWTLTDSEVAARYNNFYEFTLNKERVQKLAKAMVTTPWTVEIGGLVEQPMKVDARELISQFPLEERIYRFRCVEAWSMIVPWTGFPLASLIEKLKPKTGAKYVRFETFGEASWAPGMKDGSFPWPYFEGLRMDEAMHPLSLVGVGIYGKAMPNQHGAPLRIVVPWKYGYKSIKSIVKIEFVAEQPKTFWETMAANEYPFESNVNPAVPHPRWSQATERLIDTQERVPTLPYNGYGKEVAALYKG